MNAVAVVAAVTAGAVAGPGVRAAIVAYREPRGDPARRRCPHCGRAVSSGPLRVSGTVALTGLCSDCGARVGPPPAGTELLGAGLLGLLALRVHPTLVLAAVGLATVAAIALARIDWTTLRVPDAILAPTLVSVVVLFAAAGVVDHREHQLFQALIGGAAAFAAYTVLALATSGLGFGDCKLAALLGFELAWFGWSTLIAGLTLGFLLAAVYLVPRLITGRSSRSTRIAFGPFMILGALTVLIVVA